MTAVFRVSYTVETKSSSLPGYLKINWKSAKTPRSHSVSKQIVEMLLEEK